MRSLIAVCTGLIAASGASAALSEVQFDFQGLKVQAFDTMGLATAFGGTTHTGSLTVNGSGALISSLDITEDRSGLVSAELGAGQVGDFLFTMTLELSGGAITGGDLTISSGADTYAADIDNGVGQVRDSFGRGAPFMVEALSSGGVFNNATFSGIDISRFTAPGGIVGSIRLFEFRPNGSGFDGGTDAEVFAFVPTPGAMTIMAVGALAATRRRRA